MPQQTAGNLSSSAVMARRKRKPWRDYYPTPPWASRALFEVILKPAGLVPSSVWEPAAGGGHMARVIQEYVPRVEASDIQPEHPAVEQEDFLAEDARPRNVEAIITNPPFGLALDFTLRALKHGTALVAMLVRTAFLEGRRRHERLWSQYPNYLFCPFSERVGFHHHAAVRNVGSATFHAWVIWAPGRIHGRDILHIPPGTRAALERSDDYDADRPEAVIDCMHCGEPHIADPQAGVLPTAAHQAAGWVKRDKGWECPSCHMLRQLA